MGDAGGREGGGVLRLGLSRSTVGCNPHVVSLSLAI